MNNVNASIFDVVKNAIILVIVVTLFSGFGVFLHEILGHGLIIYLLHLPIIHIDVLLNPHIETIYLNINSIEYRLIALCGGLISAIILYLIMYLSKLNINKLSNRQSFLIIFSLYFNILIQSMNFFFEGILTLQYILFGTYIGYFIIVISFVITYKHFRKDFNLFLNE
jgi:hypothetical protein